MKEDWEYCQLEDAVKKGSSNISLNKIKGEDGEYPVFAAKGFVQNVSFYHQEEDYLAIIKDGAGIGRVSKHPAKSSIVATMQYLIPKEGFDIDFIKYFLEGIDFEKHRNGSTIPHIYFKDYKSEKFPNIPLPEQQRLVSILDKAFAAIDKAKANAEQNLQNAKELFESYLQGVFENGDWETKQLGSLCDLITKGSSPKWQGINYVDEPGILFVTSENVGEGELLLEKRKYVEEKFNQKDKKSILKNGDVLTNIVGASIGRTAIYNIDDVANINQAVCLLRCNPELINNRFLMNLLNSPFLKAILHDNEVNTARANLSLGFFNQLEIPYPTIEEQQVIVRQLDALRAETQKLEAVYQKKIADLEELKKSILQKAFAGELKTEKAVEV